MAAVVEPSEAQQEVSEQFAVLTTTRGTGQTDTNTVSWVCTPQPAYSVTRNMVGLPDHIIVNCSQDNEQWHRAATETELHGIHKHCRHWHSEKLYKDWIGGHRNVARFYRWVGYCVWNKPKTSHRLPMVDHITATVKFGKLNVRHNFIIIEYGSTLYIGYGPKKNVCQYRQACAPELRHSWSFKPGWQCLPNR